MRTESNNPAKHPSTARSGGARPAMPGEPTGPGARASRLRQTVIPLLITLAVLLPVLAIWFRQVDIDSPFRQLPSWVTPSLLCGGAASAIFAAINMAVAKRRTKR